MRSFMMFLLLLACFNTKAQELADSSKATLTLTTIAANNINYFGQSTTERYPYILFNANYRMSNGLYFTAGGYQLLNVGGALSETDLGLGYTMPITSKMDLDLAYSRSFYPSNSPLLQASNANNINATLSREDNFVSSSFETCYAFGKESDIFLTLNVKKQLTINVLPNTKNIFYIEPALEFVAGTSHYLSYYTTTQLIKNGNGKGIGNTGKTVTETAAMANSTFGMLSYNLKLPIGLSRGNYLLEACYQFSIINNQINQEVRKHQSYISLAFYYQFSL